MSSTRLRSPVVQLALVAYVCSACAPVVGHAPAPARQPSVTTDVVYGHKDGLALTFDVHRPAQPNGAGVIAIVSGGWQSSVEMSRLIVDGYLSPLLNEKGFTVFAVRHGRARRSRTWYRHGVLRRPPFFRSALISRKPPLRCA
jgi:hypothetical protein